MSTTWVVVGAGSAGTVVASRLSEDRDRHVVLLESGPDDPTKRSGASVFTDLRRPGRTHTDLRVVRVDGGPPVPYTLGRGVGGSSEVNAMIGLHGGPYDGTPHLVPTELPAPDELGPVDRALLAAAPDAAPVPLTRRGGHRVSVADAYLPEPGRRPNLEIRADSPVDRVTFTGRSVAGVVLGDGSTIAADRVVVCAGALSTPAILLRSGVDTPGVGEGLTDHPSAPLTLALRPHAVAPADSLAVGALLCRGDIQVLPLNHVGDDSYALGVLMPALMRVHSEGRVRLADDDPATPPRVEFRMLSDARDLHALADAVALALDLLRHPAFEEILDAVYVDDEGTGADVLDTPAEVAAWLPSHVGDYVHASSSCRMGVVVDDTCRVLGYDGLLVCDASVFPQIPVVNTHLPTVMLAEAMAARWRSGE